MGQDYTKKPIEELLADARIGSIEAQNSLAMLHELGLIPEANIEEAVKWYTKAAKAGDPTAAVYLGVLYEKGAEGLPVDKNASAAYFQMAEKASFHTPGKRLEDAGIIPLRQTILLVDDSPMLRTVTRTLLSRHGFEVVEAADAAQAIRFLQTGGRVDLVLSDVEMPNMDGVEMLSVIRTRLKRKELPVVMLTSVRELDVLKKAKLLGVQGWILKPYDNEMLVQIVKKALVA